MLSLTLPSDTSSMRCKMIFRVEQNHAQRFLVQHAHFCADEIANQFGRINFLPRERFARQSLAQAKSRN